MKNRIFFTAAIVLSTLAASCGSKSAKTTVERPEAKVDTITENIRFCESTYPYQDGILIANFGTEQLNPLNTEGKGYIVVYKDGRTSVLIPADGNLSAPKGMYLKDDYLFICDVNKVVVYRLSASNEKPQVIAFPKGDLFVNDLAAEGNTLYASVTNTGKIYRMDISRLDTVGAPVVWAEVPGPNGLLIENGTMYIASYPADGKTTDANAIYQITDLAKPAPQKFITTSGQYDGIALSADKKTMYITNWSPAEVSAINMETKAITPLNIGLEKPLIGAADITVTEERMYIPDLPNSRVVIFPLKGN